MYVCMYVYTVMYVRICMYWCEATCNLGYYDHDDDDDDNDDADDDNHESP